MTADQRLDQLEPLVAEALTVLDRHTVQLKRLSNVVDQIVAVVTQQSDNISFLLDEQIAIKTDVAGLKIDVADLKIDVAGLKTDVAEIKADVKAIQNEFGGKLDLILSKLT